MKQSQFRMTPGLLGKLSGLPKATLVNWLEGRVTRPRRWQDVARVADALRLTQTNASELLRSAGHPTVGELLADRQEPHDRRLLEPWTVDNVGGVAMRRKLPDVGLLIGREDSARRLARLLTEGRRRLVSVTGMPGVGKTHLAIDVARSIATHFDCEPVWIPLGAVAAAAGTAGAVADALGITPENEASLMALLNRRFDRTSILLVIDNAEHLTDAAATCMKLVDSAAGITVLLTSRVPLRCSGETEMRVSPLAIPEVAELDDQMALERNPAVRMFRAQTNAAGISPVPAQELKAIGKIVRQLDGIPLALTLAAAQTRLFAPSVLSMHLEHRFALLVNEQLAVDGKRQTLRSAIDWSYALLTADARIVFERCAIFESGWTAAAADAVTQFDDAPPRWRTLKILTILVEHGLILAQQDASGEPRFRMLDTIREYALERARSRLDDRTRTELAFARYYSSLIDDASRACEANTAPWPVALFRVEAANIQAALQLAIAHETGVPALTIATAWSLWGTRSEIECGRQLARRALKLAATMQGSMVLQLRARVHRTVGILALECDDGIEARTAFEAARALMHASGNARGRAIADSDLAFLGYRMEDAEACAVYAKRALTYFEGVEPTPHRELGWVRAYLALSQYYADFAACERQCRMALTDAKKADEKRLLAFVHHLMGLIALRSRAFVDAKQHFENSIHASFGQETSVAYSSLAGLGIVAEAMGDPARCVRLLFAADAGLARVRNYGTSIEQLTIAKEAAWVSARTSVHANVFEAWCERARCIDCSQILQEEQHIAAIAAAG